MIGIKANAKKWVKLLELSDFVWLTSDNPRSEDPMKIIRQVASGITTGNYSVSLDRKDAIREAITSSQVKTL